MLWQLVVDTDAQHKQSIPITRPVTWLGRGDGCHVRPSSLAVSRRHCVLLNRRGRLFVSACPTTNGTFVNGQGVEGERELTVGDRLRLGPVTFVVDSLAAAPEADDVVTTVEEDHIGAMLLDLDAIETQETPVPALR